MVSRSQDFRATAFHISKAVGASDSRIAPNHKQFSEKPVNDGRNINIIQYLGIAADEPERIERHMKKQNIELPLVQIGWSEAQAKQWCIKNDLLSPIYTDTCLRGGCWFCHNQGVQQLRELRHNYPELWAILLRWDSDSPVAFHADGHTVHDFDRRFQLEDEGYINASDRFHWKDLDFPQKQLSLFD